MGMMINRRRAYGGKSLPYDAEIEYLEVPSNTMNKYELPLGLKLHKDDTLILDFYIGNSNIGNLWALLFSGINAAYDARNNFKIQRYVSADFSQNYSVIRIADSWVTPLTRTWMFSLDARHSIRIELPNNIVLVDGSPIVSFPGGCNTKSDDLYDTNGYMLEMAKVLVTRENSYSPQMKLYSVKIPNRADFIPVRVGQVGYMYDKVSCQLFGNIGTGSFILGPDK